MLHYSQLACWMDKFQEVACTVKPPVYLSLGLRGYGDVGSTFSSAIKSGSESAASSTPGSGQKSGCQVVDIQLHRTAERINLLRFRNKYTYAITVLYQSSSDVASRLEAQRPPHEESSSSSRRSTAVTTGGEWRVALDHHILMTNCHCDSPSAQKWVELREEAFQSKLEDVVRLRLVLRQPSPHWKEFGVEDISCYSLVTSSESQEKGTCSSAVSHDRQGEWSSWNNVEQLLDIGRTAHSVLRREKESNGSPSSAHHSTRGLPYEINLLSTS